MEGYFNFCYSPILGSSHDLRLPDNYTLTLWANGDLEVCFESLLTCASAVLFALASALYAGFVHTKLKRQKIPHVLLLRALISLCIVLTFLVQLISSFWLAEDRPYSVLLCNVSLLLGWTVHLRTLWSMGKSVRVVGRDPVFFFCVWLTSLVMASLQLHTLIAWKLYPSAYNQYNLPIDKTYFFVIKQITIGLYFGFQVLYLFTLPFKVPPVTGNDIHVSTKPYLTTQTDDEGYLRQSLISSAWQGGSYGTVSVNPSPPLKETCEDHANILSLFTFWWVQPLLKRGSLGRLATPSDMPHLPSSLATPTVRERFRSVVSQHVEQDYSKWTLMKELNRSFGFHYYPLGVLKLMADLLGFAGPLLLHQLVAFIEDSAEPFYHGYLYALGLFLSTLLGAFLLTHFNYQVNKVGVKVRGALITEIYRKTLSVTSTTLSHFSTGQVVNFMSTDTDRIVNFCASFHQFWSLPFQVLVSLGLLYQQVGLAFLTGLGFCVLLIPINRWLAVKIGSLSTAMMEHKDSRVKVMSEVLTGIRVVKFYCWENYFVKRILGIRALELKALKGRKYLDALCVYFWATTPVLISILTFATYVAMGNTLTAAKVFTSVALFSVLVSPLNAFPWVVNGLVEAWVSLRRVSRFLQLSELTDYYTPPHEKVSVDPDCRDDADPVITINHGHFTWTPETTDETTPTKKETTPTETKPTSSQDGESTLTDINLVIRPGDLVGVVGPVGSGKSSLLAAITAEIGKTEGEVGVACVDQGFGLAAQEAWIQHATVRDNILFGLPYEAGRYNSVLHACALQQDLLILPAGDQTEVGENGVTLSGGQKARVALARAVYQDKSVYLLDDPLSAVDAHVATHIFTHCITRLLAGKTRILATHHLRFLSEAHTVIAMENGHVVSCGPPSVVLPSLVSSDHEEVPPSQEDNPDEQSSSEDVLVKEEEKEVGVVKLSVYGAYWRAVGHPLAALIMVSLFLMQASRNVSDWWLSYWIAHSYNDSEAGLNVSVPFHLTTAHFNNSIPILSLQGASDNLGFYLGIYGGLAVANTVFTLLRAFLYAYGGVRAARVIHTKLLRAIIRAPVAFFDTTPIGRIINRFSSDLYAIDDSLPFILNILLAQLFAIAGSLVVTVYGLPWMVLLLLPLGVFYYQIQHYYRRTSRELKRLSTVTLSPVYAHFSESLAGLTTIRALRGQQRFSEENTARLDLNQRANYSSFAVSQWLGIRLQMLGVAMVTGVAFVAVLEHHFNTVDPGLVGLAISYALSLTNLLSGVVTSFTETEKEMVSVERAGQYIGGVASEGQRSQKTAVNPPTNWPMRGVVEFRGVSLVYREGLPPALNNLSFITCPMEKLGVVGRTGAGKSSLFQALFRLTELTSGSILVDSVDTASLSLDTLRSGLAVIPQDPFLFSGSVRDNLDPGGLYSDPTLWTVLDKCRLKESVVSLGGLEGEVQERGRVFSVGQRQLLCLARALLTGARILCVDEATASVDMETDSRIQETIRDNFSQSTVITIAHRIETVLGCDRILVMEGGGVKELDTPTRLLENKQSLFSKLYREHTTTLSSAN